MFGTRRHRPPSQPLTAATANPNAATAAASAFTRQSSASSLSAAAAATALRSNPITPTNVAEVQTKRTMRRSASVSSAGSHNGGRGLKRSPSAGSMAERSLRAASPHRTPPSKSVANPPPVPSIPDRVTSTSNGNVRSPKRRRATSLQMQPVKEGSETLREGHVSWFGVPTIDTDTQARMSDAVLHNNRDIRPDSAASSINFSYPRGARGASPTPNSPTTSNAMSRHTQPRPSTAGSDQALVYDPNSRRMVPRSEVFALEQDLREPRRKPSRKKKKKQTSAPSSDSGVGHIYTAYQPAVEPGQPAEVRTAHEAPELVTGSMYEDMGAEIHVKTEALANKGRQSDSGPEFNVTAISNAPHDEGVSATLFPSRNVSDKPHPEAHRMSVPAVHEMADISGHHRDASPVTHVIPRRTPAHTDRHSSFELSAEHRSQEMFRAEQHASSSAEPDKADGPNSKGISNGSQKIVSLGGKEKLAVPVRHSPPLRSVSPIKSALKHSVSPNRASSISDHASEASTDVVHPHQLDPAAARKKSVRVSFDDKSTIVVRETAPDNDAPEGMSAATRKRWYNLARRRDGGTLSGDGEDGEVMKPRPMLPSFGSIRDKKAKGYEERPLVRPHSFANSPPRPALATVLPVIPSGSNPRSPVTDFAIDDAIGQALSRDLAQKHEENISGLREPLPPQVTSVEGDGFMSDETSSSLPSSDDEEQLEPVRSSGCDEGFAPPGSTTAEGDPIPARAGTASVGKQRDGGAVDPSLVPESNIAPTVRSVPQIAISQPSPQPPGSPGSSNGDSDSDVFFDTPVTFLDNGGDDEEAFTAPSLPETSRAKPESETNQSQAYHLPPSEVVSSHISKPSPSRELPVTIEEESSESGIYSDAYEDLSDLDDDVFQSLGAVVDSPARARESSGKAFANLSPVTKQMGQSNLARVASDGPVDIDWEQAKAYWKSLSAEKRRQLEREALQEAGEEADLDEAKVVAKPSKKRRLAKKERGTPGEEQVPSAVPAAKDMNAKQSGHLSRKTLRGPRPTSSDGSMSALQSQGEKQGRLRSLRSPPPATPPEASSEGGMRKSLRGLRASPDDTLTDGSSHKEKGRLSLHLPGFPSKFKTGADRRRTPSLEEYPQDSRPRNWTNSLPQRRDSVSSESSYRRSNPRSESTGFRKSMRDGASSSGTVPGSSSNKMGSFTLRSLSPSRGPFRRNSSFGSSHEASPGSRIRTSLQNESSDGSPRHIRMPSFGRLSKMGRKHRTRDLDDSSDEDVLASSPLGSHTADKSRATNGSAIPDATPTTTNEAPQDESEELSDSDSTPYQNSSVAAHSPESVLATSQATNGSLSHSRSGRGLQEAERSRKGGLMSVLRRKKMDQGRISRPERMDSAARRDTKLERSASELAALRSPTASRGQRGDRDDDSVSVEAVLGSPRNQLRKRLSAASGGKASLHGGEPKKKMFSAFRRVFKMED